MSELENNLSEIRGSLRVTYTGLHQLVGECGVTTTIPANPDEFSLTSSLAELATAMEAIPSKHAARIVEEASNGIYTGACHVLACQGNEEPSDNIGSDEIHEESDESGGEEGSEEQVDDGDDEDEDNDDEENGNDSEYDDDDY
nr:prothymosin alpha-like [Oryza sativa Japonica Group]